MAGQKVAVGIVVDKDPNSPFPPIPNDGLYLLTEDNQLYRLVTQFMAAQLPIDVLHRQSRSDFEPYLGQKVTVNGYFSGSTIFSANIEE